MFGGVAYNHAQFTALAAVDIDFRHHFAGVQIQAIGLGTIHDAEATALLGRTFLINHLRNVIHAT
jgi:hypothetical protein